MKGHFRLVIIPWKAIAWTFGHTSYTELYHFALRSIWRMTRPKSLTSSKGNKCYSMRNYKMTMKKGSGFHMMHFNSSKLINIKSRACIRNMWICTRLIESCHTGLFYCCITWTLQFEGERGKNHVVIVHEPLAFKSSHCFHQNLWSTSYMCPFVRKWIWVTDSMLAHLSVCLSPLVDSLMTSQETYASTKVEIMIHHKNEFH